MPPKAMPARPARSAACSSPPGPGATNAVTGLTDALMDSIPIVCITGQVPTHLIGSDAFQEADTVGITRHCTKHNYLVKRIEDLPRILHEAFLIASTGRPGPVVIDVPKDIQFKTGTYFRPTENIHKTYRPRIEGDADKVKAAVALMASAKKPVFYTGGGVINSGPRASALLRELVRAHRLPGHLDADGARRLSGGRSAMARHARHARHLRGQLGDARLRPDDQYRGALRRPHHRPHRCLLAHEPQDPCRHRPVLDQQERQGRYRHPRRLRPCARRRCWPPGARPRPTPTRRRCKAWWARDRGLARAQVAVVPQFRQRDQAAARDPAALRVDARTATSTSRPRSASTRCGRRSISTSRSRTAG